MLRRQKLTCFSANAARFLNKFPTVGWLGPYDSSRIAVARSYSESASENFPCKSKQEARVSSCKLDNAHVSLTTTVDISPSALSYLQRHVGRPVPNSRPRPAHVRSSVAVSD